MARVLTAGRELQAPHLALIDDHFRRLNLPPGDPDRIDRLLITMPPRHGKTRRASQWAPLWWLHRNPDHRIILTSYEADYAASQGRRVRELIDDHGAALGLKVSRASSAANRWDLQGCDGGMVTAGVGGPITGRGAHLLIIDDPVKNRAEADSPTVRQAVWEWWTSTAYTRLEPGGVVVLIQTRWHEDDLAGRVLAGDTDSEWTRLDLPAIAGPADPLGRAPGEALWPLRFPEPVLRRIQETVGARDWASLYQQTPTPATGGMWTPDDLQTALRLPPGGPAVRRVVAVDPSASGATGTDECGIVIVEADRDGLLTVLDDRSGRMAPDVWARAAWQALLDHEADEVLWERNLASGVMDLTLRSAWQAMVRDGAASGGQPRMRPLSAKGDKAFRASPVAQAYRERRVRHARSLPALEDQLLRWQPGQASPDRMDALVHAVTDLLGDTGSALDLFLGKA